ncbi:hypothetical protein LCGC14_2759860 [marine sediment metagenome]|uniref:Uncharacterized protein n=1 Tax=marine sediment metagenome TaxID=412755 RepID=A0A0F9B7T6_9ZZZZ
MTNKSCIHCKNQDKEEEGLYCSVQGTYVEKYNTCEEFSEISFEELLKRILRRNKKCQ